ncbi:hypothetical protein DL766_007045 [Monosporascus sp. MC13-8B]|uniref:Necrosis inducing protein (NPP1) n=1 Tax=Monosporascus cannonballus TaxID=155416 RepID=A0ABY0H511_9PEZI|nr:hypothetical protein DL762_006898 [Monosporascus cannonballus]RYO97192.1 hypothetical protein DL763_002853 [Monosporascus cannonballus]RYP25431.1 hypothetical protein DL766_007045 [Monosporascus sp. MC13-8B]
MLFFKFQKIGLLAILLSSSTASLLWPFPTSATENAKKFQPVLDFDKDGCYHTAAIDQAGSVNAGLHPLEEGECRAQSQLWFSQTYVRQHCNHGWCAYLYGYYFEKDKRGTFADGHRHDWEHVIVWTLNDEVFYVSWSGHGGYTTEHQSVVRFHERTHPKIVYHRGGLKNNSFRKAKPEYDDIENISGEWFKAPFLSSEWMACDIKKKLLYNNWGSAHPDLRADRFAQALDDAMPPDARNNEHFYPWN